MKFGLAPTTCATVSDMILSLGPGQLADRSGGIPPRPRIGATSIAEFDPPDGDRAGLARP